MNILFLNDHTTMGGAEKSLVLLIKNLDSNLFNPIGLVDAGNVKLIQSLEEDGIRYITMPYVYGDPARSVPQILKNLFKLRRIIKRYSIDVLYSNTVRSNKFASLYKLFFLSGIKSVWHVRDMGAEWRPVDRFITPFVTDRIIVVSRAVGEYHKRLFGFYKDFGKKTAVVYNAAVPGAYRDKTEFKKYKTRFGLDESGAVLCAGRLVSLKGYEYVIEAMLEVTRRHRNAKLLLAGEGSDLPRERDYLKSLHELVLDYKLQGKVIFTGFVKNIEDLIPAADLVVVPSIKNDSCPRMVIEAMAGGKPVIGTEVGGIPELITEGKDGFLVQPGNSGQIADRIIEILSDDSMRERMGKNARRTARKRFRVEEQAMRIEKLLREL